MFIILVIVDMGAGCHDQENLFCSSLSDWLTFFGDRKSGYDAESFYDLLVRQKLTNHIFCLPVLAIDGIVKPAHLLHV